MMASRFTGAALGLDQLQDRRAWPEGCRGTFDRQGKAVATLRGTASEGDHLTVEIEQDLR